MWSISSSWTFAESIECHWCNTCARPSEFSICLISGGFNYRRSSSYRCITRDSIAQAGHSRQAHNSEGASGYMMRKVLLGWDKRSRIISYHLIVHTYLNILFGGPKQNRRNILEAFIILLNRTVSILWTYSFCEICKFCWTFRNSKCSFSGAISVNGARTTVFLKKL